MIFTLLLQACTICIFSFLQPSLLSTFPSIPFPHLQFITSPLYQHLSTASSFIAVIGYFIHHGETKTNIVLFWFPKSSWFVLHCSEVNHIMISKSACARLQPKISGTILKIILALLTSKPRFVWYNEARCVNMYLF